MGAKNNKSKKTKTVQNTKESLENKEKYKQNLDNQNPFFKKKEIFSHSKCIGFEIYKLKNINNAFYLAFTPYKEDDTVIYKYFFEKEKFEKITTIKIYKGDLDKIIIKYFYNPLNKKEYLFVVRKYDDIETILIKKENNFEFINKNEIIPIYNHSRDVFKSINEIELFEIIYNQYDNNIYVIISYYLGETYDILGSKYTSNKIRILSLQNDKLILIKEFEYPMNDKGTSYPFDLMKIIYEDKYSEKYYILMVIYNNLQFIEIKNKYKENYQNENFFVTENDLKLFKETIKEKIDFKGCIINLLYFSEYSYH